ncbi:unnamed protein product [Ilex paraguariensis]|uniref:Bifunctional inhibitor/plant lipid transfer protein/seed storage helical domain-containing protein n=1 Tax=Ilex paraguariensis TaxID=185542 RepID=A0ABC8ULE9_9AQUA
MAKKMTGGGFVWAAVLVVLALTATFSTTAIKSCGVVVRKFQPCEQFLVGTSSKPTSECCAVAEAVDNIAGASQADWAAVCKCLKAGAQKLKIISAKAHIIPSYACSILT